MAAAGCCPPSVPVGSSQKCRPNSSLRWTLHSRAQETDLFRPHQVVMSRFATRRAPARINTASSLIIARYFICAMMLVVIAGCNRTDPIVTYTVPTVVPQELQPGKERMLAAMLPKGDQVWFYKVTGPEDSIASVESEFRGLVEATEFTDGAPALANLPDGWRLGPEKAMRFATINVPTPDNQLNISVSQLGRNEDWDEQVKLNVNRWRGQLGLSPSEDKWAEGVEFDVAAADAKGIWVDLVGDPSSGGAPMMAPFAGGMADGPKSKIPQTPPDDVAMEADPRVKFDRPEGWRDGRMSSMRMAAFNVGPEDSLAELTVIPAGGDLRGNVARWLGQVREEQVPDEVVDKALAEAKVVEVAGRSGQRFFLSGEDATSGTVIDATIVPMDGGMSLFVKMTGPAKTVTEQSEAITSFLESLELNL